MGVINVEGLGQVEIKGVSPNEEEQQLILDALSETDGEGQQSIMPDLINPDLAEDRDTSPKGLELIGGRPTFEAAGAVFGGSVGGLGLNPVTMVAGGTLASAGGGQLYDIIQGSITGDSSTMEDQFGYLKKDLQREALLQTFFAKIPGFGTWAKSKLVNKNDKTKSLHKSAKEIGFPLSISDTGNMVAKGYGSVVGVFPLVGSPIKASVVTKANMLNKAADDTLNTFAPNVSLTNLGIDMVEASKSTFGDFKRVTSFLYDDFYNTASKMKAPIIPTESLKKSLTNYVNLVDDGIIKVNGKNIKSPNKDAIYKYAKSLKNVDPYINISQWKSLVRDMKKFAKLSSKEGYDQSTVFAFKGALEKDLNMLTNSKYLKSFEKVLNPQLMNDVRSKLLFANKVYANGLENSLVNKIVKDKNLKDFAKKKGVSLKETMTTIPGKNAFDSNVAKQFKRVDKNIFGPGFEKQGGVYADQLADVLLKNKNITPQYLDDLYTLVGKDNYNKFVRQNFTKAYNNSLVDNGVNGLSFDPFKFEDALGLTTKNGRELMETMLKDSPLKIQKLDAFFDIAKNHGSLNVPDVSKFIQRRAVLGGTKSVFGGMMMGYSTFNNPVRGLGLIYMARKGSKLLVDPKNLDLVMDGLNYNAPGPKVYNATLKMVDALISDESNTNQATNEFKLIKSYLEENKKQIIEELSEDNIN